MMPGRDSFASQCVHVAAEAPAYCLPRTSLGYMVQPLLQAFWGRRLTVSSGMRNLCILCCGRGHMLWQSNRPASMRAKPKRGISSRNSIRQFPRSLLSCLFIFATARVRAAKQGVLMMAKYPRSRNRPGSHDHHFHNAFVIRPRSSHVPDHTT
jgi:hypothetical protein